VLAADVHDTCLVGPAALPIRQIRNAFTRKFDAAPPAEREALFKQASLKQAALEGDVEWGKVEAGQSAGLVDDIVPAADLMQRLVRELEDARRRLASL
jgi:enoyl-[acyl-carrier protein] reductase II